MRQPDVAPEVQLQQQAEASPSKEEEYVENTYGPTGPEQCTSSTQTTPGVTDTSSAASPKVETPAKVSTPPSEALPTTKKTTLPAVTSNVSTLHSPKTNSSQAVKPPQTRPVQSRPAPLPAPPVPAEELLTPPVPGSAE